MWSVPQKCMRRKAKPVQTGLGLLDRLNKMDRMKTKEDLDNVFCVFR